MPHNRISSIPSSLGEGGVLPLLRRVNLAYNKIADIEEGCFPHLTALEELDLRWNRLSSLPSDVDSCGRLRKLYLTGNDLLALPVTIAKMRSL